MLDLNCVAINWGFEHGEILQYVCTDSTMQEQSIMHSNTAFDQYFFLERVLRNSINTVTVLFLDPMRLEHETL